VSGRFIAVVGPSGVGKDSVMRAIAAKEPRMVLARRMITRAADAGGEDFDAVTQAAYDAALAADGLALHWSAHGLSYAIACKAEADLLMGKDVLANLSRTVLPQAHARFAHLEVVQLTATRHILAKRLRARGRETAAQIAERLDRVGTPLPTGLRVHTVDNSGALSDTVQRVCDLLYPVSA